MLTELLAISDKGCNDCELLGMLFAGWKAVYDVLEDMASTDKDDVTDDLVSLLDWMEDTTDLMLEDGYLEILQPEVN